MFSGFRNVVENLAQPQPRPSRSGRSQSRDYSPERPEPHHARASASFDLSGVAHSTSHLAESAFSNLRKTLAVQRPFSATSPPTTGVPSTSPSPQPDRELRPVMKPTLEDRLRASFAIGEASNPTTPDPSHAPSPMPVVTTASERVASPKSTPLPDSPATSLTMEIDLASPPPLDLYEPSAEDHPFSEGYVIDATEEKRMDALEERGIRIDISPVRFRYPEADIPLPPFSPSPTNLAASQSSHNLQSDSISQVDEDADDLRARLSSLEKAFIEVSSSLELLRTTQDAVDAVLVELTPVAHISDVKGLKEHLMSLNSQQNLSQEEIKRLNSKLRTYDDRIEELRDTHRLESHSQTDLVHSLRKQVAESEALLKVAHDTATRAEKDIQKRQAELDQMRVESQKLKDTAKEEEEKRVKAVSLLKTVRQKLVKAEKDRDDAIKQAGTLKEKENIERERGRAEKEMHGKELENVRAEKEEDIAGLKAHFDRELASMKEKLEKDFTARKSQLELEAASTKAAHQKEVVANKAKIQTLENSVRSLNSERDSLFDQLQMRQAELESSQSLLESLQSSTSELQFQIREATDRSSLLAEELADARRELEYRDFRPSISAKETERVRGMLEAKYEMRIGELSARLTEVERDRNDAETALSRNLQQKMQEIEALRSLADTSTESKGISEEEVSRLKKEIEGYQHQVSACKEQLLDLDRQRDRVHELEAQVLRQFEDFSNRTEQYEGEVAKVRDREAQIKAANKSLREELRKVQNSAALLERQRNPGVGYWSTVARPDNPSEARLSSPSTSTFDLASLSRTGSPAPAKNDEEVNLEYLRNVILQFLEHKDMRPHLVRVLSIILHFTPQETRRLIAKV